MSSAVGGALGPGPQELPSFLEEPALRPASHHLQEMPMTDKLLPFIDRTERQRQRQTEREGEERERERTRAGGEEKRRQADITASCL